MQLCTHKSVLIEWDRTRIGQYTYPDNSARITDTGMKSRVCRPKKHWIS